MKLTIYYDQQVLDFVNRVMLGLLNQASPLVEVARPMERKINPKRLAREAAKEVS